MNYKATRCRFFKIPDIINIKLQAESAPHLHESAAHLLPQLSLIILFAGGHSQHPETEEALS